MLHTSHLRSPCLGDGETQVGRWSYLIEARVA